MPTNETINELKMLLQSFILHSTYFVQNAFSTYLVRAKLGYVK
jgi:hypothetical protein